MYTPSRACIHAVAYAEYSKRAPGQLKAKGVTFRHSRERKSNDNAHIERFRRTVQEEMLSKSVHEEKVPNMIQE